MSRIGTFRLSRVRPSMIVQHLPLEVTRAVLPVQRAVAVDTNLAAPGLEERVTLLEHKLAAASNLARSLHTRVQPCTPVLPFLPGNGR